VNLFLVTVLVALRAVAYFLAMVIALSVTSIASHRGLLTERPGAPFFGVLWWVLLTWVFYARVRSDLSRLNGD
jgi:hypothetical protein